MTIINNLTNFVASPLSVMGSVLAVAVVALYVQRKKEACAVSPEMRKRRAVLITGASRGIGKTIALHLSSLGYTVFGSVRSQSSYDSLIASNNNEQDDDDSSSKNTTEGKIIPVIFDVTKDKEIQTAVTTIENICKENGLDFMAIINNAGINPEGDMYAKVISETGNSPNNILSDSEIVTNVFDTNVVSCFRVTKAFMPLLNKGKASSSCSSSIVLVGSFFGSIAGALNLSHLAYESSKICIRGSSRRLTKRFEKGTHYC